MEDLTEEQIAAFETQLRALREDLVAALSDARTDTGRMRAVRSWSRRCFSR